MTRNEALVKWLVDESSLRYDSKWFQFAEREMFKALGVPVTELDVWAETYHHEALAHFNRTYPHD